MESSVMSWVTPEFDVWCLRVQRVLKSFSGLRARFLTALLILGIRFWWNRSLIFNLLSWPKNEFAISSDASGILLFLYTAHWKRVLLLKFFAHFQRGTNNFGWLKMHQKIIPVLSVTNIIFWKSNDPWNDQKTTYIDNEIFLVSVWTIGCT